MLEHRKDTVGYVHKVVRKKKFKRKTKHRTPNGSVTLQRLYMLCREVFKGPGTIPSPADVQKLCHILGMTVFSKLLLGTMHIKVYDWANPPSSDLAKSTSKPNLARLKTDSIFTAPCNSSVLYPTSGGNIHEFTAITPCEVLDVLGPPYSGEDGRDCSFYRDTPCLDLPSKQKH